MVRPFSEWTLKETESYWNKHFTHSRVSAVAHEVDAPRISDTTLVFGNSVMEAGYIRGGLLVEFVSGVRDDDRSQERASMNITRNTSDSAIYLSLPVIMATGWGRVIC